MAKGRNAYHAVKREQGTGGRTERRGSSTVLEAQRLEEERLREQQAALELLRPGRLFALTSHAAVLVVQRDPSVPSEIVPINSSQPPEQPGLRKGAIVMYVGTERYEVPHDGMMVRQRLHLFNVGGTLAKYSISKMSLIRPIT